MATVLSKGVIVPDPGETDWAGYLAINWGKLNEVVGAALPDAQNVWTQPQIFQNNIYLTNTSYTVGTIPDSNITTTLFFAGASNYQIGYCRGVVYKTTGQTSAELTARNKFTNGVLDPTGSEITSSFNVEVQSNGEKTLYFDGSIRNNVLPYVTNTYSLGSSSYQWSSVYAQTYYYNGTAWGLDQANVWTGSNTYTDSILSKVDSSTLASFKDIYQCQNEAGYRVATFRVTHSNSSRILSINVHDNNNSAPKGIVISNDGNNNINLSATGTTNSLGSSTFKWKSLNGINPGALSLPSFSSSDPTMLIWSNLDTTNWYLDGTGNDVSIALDGFVFVSVFCGTDGYVVISEGQYGYPNCFYMSTGTCIAGAASALLPVRKGVGITVYCKGTSVYLARFFPMQGNV